MARIREIALPWTQQPQEAVSVAPDWVARGLSFALLRVGGRMLDVFRADGPLSDSGTTALSPDGIVTDYTGSQVTEFADAAPYRITGGLTLIAGLEIDAFANYTAITFKQSSYWKASFEWRHGRVSHNNSDPAGAQAVFIRGNDSVTGEYCSVGGPTTTGRRVSAVSVADGSLLSSPVFYVDGMPLAAATVGASAGTVVDGGNLRIGQRFDGVVQLDGRVSFLYGFSQQLPGADVAALSANPWQLFAPRRIRVPVYGAAPAGVPDVTFVGAENILATSAGYRVTLDYA